MKVTKYRKNDKPGTILAFVNIVRKDEYGAMFFNDLKLCMKDGKYWIAFPSRTYKDEYDQTKYYSEVGYTSKEGSQKFQDAVMAAIDEFTKKGGTMSKEVSENPDFGYSLSNSNQKAPDLPF